MNPLILIVGLFVLYEFLVKKNSTAVTATSSPSVTAKPPVSISPIMQQGQAVSAPAFQFAPGGGGPGTGSALIGSSVAVGTSGAVVGAIGLAGSALGSAIPIVGAAFAAIFGALMAASAKRAAEARNENNAVANEVPAWDSAISQIVSAYNNGQISADEAYQLLACPQTRQQGVNQYPNGAVWRAYWNVVCPQVQPGRNACNCGTAPHQPPLTHCSGAYGAGCCVAYDDLDNGQLYVVWAIQKAEQAPGMTVTSQMIPTVYASKYGGINRPGYTVSVRKVAASSNVIGL